MEPKNPDYAERVRAIVEDAPFTRSLGLRLERVEPGLCRTVLPIRPDLCQQDGYVHAGVQATMADHTAGSAAYSLLAAGDIGLTVEFKINLLAPATGERLECEATLVRAGRRISVAESTVYAVGEERRACARALVTLALVGGG